MADSVAYKNFTETDFSTIKDSLKNYLKNQDEFKDFNFDGSAINVLLNVLAYNTQYNAYYLNMNASEKFISHAQKRESVVGLANNIGYVPRSRKSAEAKISIEITPDSGYTDPITIPKNTAFTATIDGVDFQFLTKSSYIANINVDGLYVFEDIELIEGRGFTHRFIVDQSTKFYTIPNIGVDTDRLSVFVKPSAASSESTEFLKFDDFTEIESDSEVYFIQETYNQLYSVYFGDGIIGKSLDVGNQVVVEYFICSGMSANGAKTFSMTDEVTGVDSIRYTSVTPAFGGSDIESIDSIRLSAPTNYITQNRAVIASDYETIIKREFPSVEFVSVWGGEDSNPPQYGKVIISVMGSDGNLIPQDQKDQIKDLIKSKYTIMSIFPEIIDPIRLYIELNLSVKYNSTNLVGTLSELRSNILTYIDAYSDAELEAFGVRFRESRFLTGVDDISNVISSDSTTRVYYKFSDFVGMSSISFNQEIVQGSITSTEFVYSSFDNCTFSDSNGNLNIVRYNQTTDTIDIVQSSVGIVDYLTGTVSYQEPNSSFYSIYIATNNDIKLFATVNDSDIEANNNTVLLLDQSDINLVLVNDI